MDAFFKSLFSSAARASILSIAYALVLFLAGYYLIRWLARRLSRRLEGKGHLDLSIQRLILQLVRWGLTTLLLISCLSQLGVNTASLVTVLGTLGVAFSLAMQSGLSNLAGGIFLLVTKPFHTGDYIEAAGAEGTVDNIGFLHTRLLTTDNRSIHVPNGAVIAGNVTNYSLSRRQLDLEIPIPYSAPLEQAQAVIRGVLAGEARILEEPMLRVWNMDASSVTLKLRAWCAGSDYWTLRSDLLAGIKTALDQNGLSLAAPRMDIHLTDPVPAGSARIHSEGGLH